MLSLTRRTAGRSLAARMPVKRFYHENIVEHYENPRNVGSLDKNDESVGTVRFLFLLFCCCCCLEWGVEFLDD